MKKWLLIGFGLILLVGSLFYFEKKNENTVDSSIEKKVEEKDYEDFVKHTDKYIGYTIEGEGLVDESVYIEGEGVYTAVVLNLRDYSNVIMLFEKGQTRELEPQIMVNFKGKIKELYKNKKKFKQAVSMPKINIENLTVETQENVDHKDLFRVEMGIKQEKQEIHVTLEKVAIFNSATRVYVTISNHSDHDIYLNEASIELLADGEVIPGKYEMLDKKIRLERYLIPKDETYGALSFNKIKIATEKIQFKISFSSEENEKPIDFKFKENL